MNAPTMNAPAFASRRISRISLTALAFTAALLAGCSGMHRNMGSAVTLSGAQEVPPVVTSATGTARIMVHSDKSVSGRIDTSGLDGTMAHIHIAARGSNGPVIVPMNKEGSSWVIAPGAKLTDAQYDAYKAGNLYVNVHTAVNKGGEIRAQLVP